MTIHRSVADFTCAPLALAALVILAAGGCAGELHVESPYPDEDLDGVPDDRDVCASTAEGALTDQRGCSAAQAAGCSVTPVSPEGTVSGTTITFDFEGDCEGYRLVISDDPGFPLATTHHLVHSLHDGELSIVTSAIPDDLASPLYWAVEGSARGHRFLSDPLQLTIEGR
jgi:hypothetical protein